MNDQDILDAPDLENGSIKFSLKLVLWTIFGFAIAFGTLLWADANYQLSAYRNYKIFIFSFDLTALLLLVIITFGLYFFTSFVDFRLSDWYRVMVVSVSIVFSAFVILVLLAFLFGEGGNISKAFRIVAFISLASGGISVAIQFLHKKKYLFFLIGMVLMMLYFSLGKYL